MNIERALLILKEIVDVYDGNIYGLTRLDGAIAKAREFIADSQPMSDEQRLALAERFVAWVNANHSIYVKLGVPAPDEFKFHQTVLMIKELGLTISEVKVISSDTKMLVRAGIKSVEWPTIWTMKNELGMK